MRDLAATIAGLKEQAGQLRAAVVADKGTADGLVQRFRAVGVEGGPVARLSGCGAGHERAVSQLEAIESRLERARFIAMSAISGLHGSGAVARSGDQADDPTSWEKPTPGTELAEASRRESRARQALRKVTARADDVADSLKNIGKNADTARNFVRDDREPPEFQNISTTTQVPDNPVLRTPNQEQHGVGGTAVAAFIAALVVARGVQWTTDKVAKSRRWRGDEPPR